MVLAKRAAILMFVMTCFVCCMIGCAPSNSVADATGTKQIALNKAGRLMQLAENSKDQMAANYKLQAIEQLIVADNIPQAEKALNENLKGTKLDSNNAAFKQILMAQIDLSKRKLTEAKHHLRQIWTPAKLPESLLVKFYITRAEIYSRSGNLLDAIQERIYLAKHLHTPEEQTSNNNIIWDSLMQLTPTTLQGMHRDSEKTALNGWLEFASITKQYDASADQQKLALDSWYSKYPLHPAINLIPEHIAKLQETSYVDKKIINTPKKIALLLPLQGAHAKSAQAIRDGFLSAFYAQKEGHDKPSVQIYDTTSQSSLSYLYRQVIAEGADFIVGPLTKEEVDDISSNIRPQIPMLTLNSASRPSAQDNILQFSLSPEVEAQAVARKAWQDGHRNALVIIPKSVWGQRMLNAFEKSWVSMGGSIIGVEEIGSQSDLTKGVKRLLAIDDSEARAQTLKQAGLKFTFDPRRRQDIDMIFIGTNAALARQVKPLLNFYFASNLPAYASSSIFTGKAQPNLDQDLNGIQFCDMPWILDESLDTHGTFKAAAELWPNDFDQYARLYALGLDAYKIALQIEQLTSMPDLGISGMTGMLTLDKQQSIERKLMWASFKKGLPHVSGDQL